MRVAFCVPPKDDRLNATCVPYGLGALASYLRCHVEGVEVKIFDGIAESNIFDLLKDFVPDVVAVTATTPQAPKAYELLGWCKKQFKNVLTVMGGVHASSLPDEALGFADVVVIGEGEIVFCEIVKKLMQSVMTKGIIQGVPLGDLDCISTPYDLLDVKEYLGHGPVLPRLEHPIMNMVTSRGCPFSCPFCKNSTRKEPVRYQNASRIVAEILFLHERFGVTNFYFSDDEFLLNVRRLKELALLFKKHKVDEWIRWACQARAKNTSFDTLVLAKSMGCVTIAFGLESGCQKSLDYWKCKTTSVSDNERALKLARLAGICGGGSFIFGGPEESFKDMVVSRDWILFNKDLFFVGLGTLMPFPGTTVFDYCVEKGLLPKKLDYNRFAPTSHVECAYYVNRHVNFSVYKRFLVHSTRLARLFCDSRRVKGLKGFLRFCFSKRFLWGCFKHPYLMLRLVKSVLWV